MDSNSNLRPIIVFTTSDQRSILKKIADCLVEQKLAACVQILGPISSCYQWQGAVETSEEWLGLIKTSDHLYPELEKKVLSLHNYDEPQITAVEINRGSSTYLNWMAGNLRPLHDPR